MSFFFRFLVKKREFDLSHLNFAIIFLLLFFFLFNTKGLSEVNAVENTVMTDYSQFYFDDNSYWLSVIDFAKNNTNQVTVKSQRAPLFVNNSGNIILNFFDVWNNYPLADSFLQNKLRTLFANNNLLRLVFMGDLFSTRDNLSQYFINANERLYNNFFFGKNIQLFFGDDLIFQDVPFFFFDRGCAFNLLFKNYEMLDRFWRFPARLYKLNNLEFLTSSYNNIFFEHNRDVNSLFNRLSLFFPDYFSVKISDYSKYVFEKIQILPFLDIWNNTNLNTSVGFFSSEEFLRDPFVIPKTQSFCKTYKVDFEIPYKDSILEGKLSNFISSKGIEEWFDIGDSRKFGSDNYKGNIIKTFLFEYFTIYNNQRTISLQNFFNTKEIFYYITPLQIIHLCNLNFQEIQYILHLMNVDPFFKGHSFLDIHWEIFSGEFNLNKIIGKLDSNNQRPNFLIFSDLIKIFDSIFIRNEFFLKLLSRFSKNISIYNYIGLKNSFGIFVPYINFMENSFMYKHYFTKDQVMELPLYLLVELTGNVNLERSYKINFYNESNVNSFFSFLVSLNDFYLNRVYTFVTSELFSKNQVASVVLKNLFEHKAFYKQHFVVENPWRKCLSRNDLIYLEVLKKELTIEQQHLLFSKKQK